ncbi:flagellar hook protein FlgE [Oxalobacteraceae bacterium GrIS 1.11]
MTLSALSTGLSSLSANQRALDVAGNNIANASTAGFQAQGLAFQESSPAGAGVSLSVEGRALAAGGANGVDLATEITNSLVYKAGVDLSAKVIKSADETLGTLIDIRA